MVCVCDCVRGRVRAADASERGRSSEGKCVRYCSRLLEFLSFFFFLSLFLFLSGWRWVDGGGVGVIMLGL